MDPLWVRTEDDPRTCRACGRSGKHEEYTSYQCAVFDRNAARAGLVLAEKAYWQNQEMRGDAAVVLTRLINGLDNQDAMIEQLREALAIAETHRVEMDDALRLQESAIKHMDRQSITLVDSIRAAKKRFDDETRALWRAGERDSLFDGDMGDDERVHAREAQFWDSETEWWDEEWDEDDPEDLRPAQERRYDDWTTQYEEERWEKREELGRDYRRTRGRLFRGLRQAYESRRNHRNAGARDGNARGSHGRVKQEEEGSRPPLPARDPADGRQRMASEQTRRRSRVEAWAAGVQTPTPGPSVKREDYEEDDLTDDDDDEDVYEDDWDEAEAEKREGYSLPPLAGVPPAFVKREETADEVLPIAVDASDRAQVKQESEPEPDPSRIQRGNSSRHFGGGPAAAEASTASAGRPQRTTRRTRRTQPYPN
ncbi:hypothetical protein CkaCkLH20_03904 [Colletotrichum karsti]|uniref:Uncharacterized protein n=1 Tax=Colletotrichum karsti TaxID=1095194 RepID=A0A9P6I7N4_9PEZI|nr:uncharacterized protein CkaCkLH20_03904 [Colletotrichum karsti]KAF9878412.1 hypothetical protein CkaCkLH20_03904 [Colletotrichum karsti]